MIDFIVLAIVFIIVGSAIGYIIKAKKSGVKCIGCSVEGACPHRKNNYCDVAKKSGCSCQSDK